MAIKKPKDGYNYIAPSIKEVVINTSKYMGIEEQKEVTEGIVLENYANKTTTNIKKELENKGIKVVTLGTGNKIINQYPNKGMIVYKNDTIYLLTNNYNKTMINLKGLSYKDVKSVLNLIGTEYELDGYGYVVSQNIEQGNIIDKKVVVELKDLYNLTK